MTPTLKFVHSFSTRPLLIDCYGVDGLRRLLTQMWYFALSVAFLKRSGQKVVLHTDTLGKAILGHIPYDEIHLTLDEMPEDINPRFWAAAKFVALLAESAPCIHIDGDVFIKSPRLAEMLHRAVSLHDVVVQSVDAAVMYSLEIPLFDKERSFCARHFCTPDGRDALNTGILGFGSDDVRRQVVENYLKIVRYFSDNHPEELKERNLTPDLIAEQKMIESLSRASGWSVWKLLEKKEQAVAIGYQHVYTVDKFAELSRCAETLLRVNPELHRACMLKASGFDRFPEVTPAPYLAPAAN